MLNTAGVIAAVYVNILGAELRPSSLWHRNLPSRSEPYGRKLDCSVDFQDDYLASRVMLLHLEGTLSNFYSELALMRLMDCSSMCSLGCFLRNRVWLMMFGNSAKFYKELAFVASPWLLSLAKLDQQFNLLLSNIEGGH